MTTHTLRPPKEETKLEYPAYMQKLTDDHRSKKITLAELEKQCAYWLLTDGCFKELYPDNPPSRPYEMGGYEQLKGKDLEQAHRNPIVTGYFLAAGRVLNMNRSKQIWLEEAREVLKDDPEAVRKIDERLRYFGAAPVIREPDYSARKMGERE